MPGTILSGHTDVVPVDGQSWSTDPFRLTERNGRLYGRGATDMKGFDACCLAAVPDMNLAAPLTRPIHLALSYDEEVGCIGVRGMIARLERAQMKPAACFVGEPTEMGVVIGHKGKRSFRVTVHGKTCHSSLAPRGVNAVEYAARLIVKIRDIGKAAWHAQACTICIMTCPTPPPILGLCMAAPRSISCPMPAPFGFEFRPLATDDVGSLVDEVMADARERLELEMRAVDPAARIAFEPKSSWPGLETPAAFPMSSGSRRRSPAATSTARSPMAPRRDCLPCQASPTVVIGPGSIEQAHKADEYIAVAQLEACSAFLDRLTTHSCG